MTNLHRQHRRSTTSFELAFMMIEVDAPLVNHHLFRWKLPFPSLGAISQPFFTIHHRVLEPCYPQSTSIPSIANSYLKIGFFGPADSDHYVNYYHQKTSSCYRFRCRRCKRAALSMIPHLRSDLPAQSARFEYSQRITRCPGTSMFLFGASLDR